MPYWVPILNLRSNILHQKTFQKNPNTKPHFTTFTLSIWPPGSNSARPTFSHLRAVVITIWLYGRPLMLAMITAWFRKGKGSLWQLFRVKPRICQIPPFWPQHFAPFKFSHHINQHIISAYMPGMISIRRHDTFRWWEEEMEGKVGWRWAILVLSSPRPTTPYHNLTNTLTTCMRWAEIRSIRSHPWWSWNGEILLLKISLVLDNQICKKIAKNWGKLKKIAQAPNQVISIRQTPIPSVPDPALSPLPFGELDHQSHTITVWLMVGIFWPN